MARYRFTPRRRAALRRAQLISARKRAGTSKGMSTRKKVAIAGAAAVAVGAGAYVAQDRVRNVRIYHATDKRYVPGIKKNGLHGVKAGSYSHRYFNEPVGQVFVMKGRNGKNPFGNRVVSTKMNRKEFNRVATRDLNMQMINKRAHRLDESHLVGKKLRVRHASVRNKILYKHMFPDGTKESYGMSKGQRKKAASVNKLFDKVDEIRLNRALNKGAKRRKKASKPRSKTSTMRRNAKSKVQNSKAAQARRKRKAQRNRKRKAA